MLYSADEDEFEDEPLMHLKSLTLKGFKSFPDRTKLDFAPGVSVVVGPNGSGKSNVTDAVLWAMGEQSPLAVRGQSMQDVIFGGGKGVQARSAAEVELVLDNADGAVDLPMGEISILRRLDRSGEGEYRLNGARCRLVDVLEVLSDTGLGKEMHSVVSQGRVEAIVTSKPRDRRLLIEEAAGLGKHRKRRRRAQLKLERTQDNLDRALDVEREARSRLRPLKRQAEAAELHERLERQTVEARWELARDAVRARARGAGRRRGRRRRGARRARGGRRPRWPRSPRAARRPRRRWRGAPRSARRSRGACIAARSAAERVELRLERTRETAEAIAERIERRGRQLEALRAAGRGGHARTRPAASASRRCRPQLERARRRSAPRRSSASSPRSPSSATPPRRARPSWPRRSQERRAALRRGRRGLRGRPHARAARPRAPPRRRAARPRASAPSSRRPTSSCARHAGGARASALAGRRARGRGRLRARARRRRSAGA